MRWSLFNEIVLMSWDTLRGNKMRSALTVLGIVIGITSIVGMTALIRGFDQSLRDSIQSLGPDAIVVIPQTTYQERFGIQAFRHGKGEMRSILISAVPSEGVARGVALQEVE